MKKMPKLVKGATSLFDNDAYNNYDFTSLGFSPEIVDAGRPGTPAASPADGTDSGLTVLYNPDSGSLTTPTRGVSSPGTIQPITVVGTTTSPFVVNITWDASVASAPTGFTAGVTAAVQYLEGLFTDAVTININVGYGEVNGTALSSNALGQSVSYLTSTSYSTLRSALAADATTATDTSSVASLPATAPVSGTFWTTTAEAKALGMAPATGTSTDGYVGFSSAYAFTYNNATGVAAGTYDFNGVVLHEITEVMGRVLLTGRTVGTTVNSYTADDLFHFSAPGVRTFTASTPGYFSADNGTTNLAAFNTAGGDAGDWSSTVLADAGDASSSSGKVNAFSSADMTAMDTFGWNLGAPPPPPAPTGVAVSLTASGLAAISTTSGLAANTAVATVTQTGGRSGDSFSYTFGGLGAPSFALTSGGALSTGASAVAGAVNGKLYALTVTATDTTAGPSSPASPIDVVVGSSGNDTVPLATLVGSGSTAAPTFVYGLAGNDTINGAGMTGKLWIDGGAGADTMTGGSGANSYEYGAIGDSTASAMDIVTNFHASTDLIDLRGLGGHALSYAGLLSGKSLAAYSIGYQATGGNTFLLVNATSGSQTLTTNSMKIELAGSIALGTGNILHV
jgi:hypothetical protein